MKKQVVAMCAAFGLVACQPGDNVAGSTAVGTIAGGMIGSALFHGSGQWAGVLGGAVLGGIVGNHVGQAMDQRDRMNMQNAISNTPVGQEATWTNTNSNTSYQVRPVKDYHQHNHYCREFQTTVMIAGKAQKGYGKACRQPDGTWKIVS